MSPKIPYFLLEKSHISHIFFKMLSGQPGNASILPDTENDFFLKG